MSKRKVLKKGPVPAKRTLRKKAKHYSHEYLVIALCAVLLMELMAFNHTTAADWKAGVSLLDMSEEVSVTGKNLEQVFAPMMASAQSIDLFYEAAADEIIPMLDMSDSDPLLVVRGIDEFYRLASIELEKVLDLSGTPTFGQVAGAMIEAK